MANPMKFRLPSCCINVKRDVSASFRVNWYWFWTPFIICEIVCLPSHIRHTYVPIESRTITLLFGSIKSLLASRIQSLSFCGTTSEASPLSSISQFINWFRTGNAFIIRVRSISGRFLSLSAYKILFSIFFYRCQLSVE